MPFSNEDILALWLQKNISDALLLKILDSKISSQTLWHQPPLFLNNALWHQCKKQFFSLQQSRLYQHHLQWLERPLNHIIVFGSTHYPKWLQEIPDPPPVLLVQGDHKALDNLQLAVVGSRKMTAYGKKWGYEISYECARMGLTITSGLAIGIDSIAHQGALDANGQTIAVIGSGFDHLYPRCHTKLAQRIIDQGALVSSFPLDQRPRPYHFPLRNRIVVGLSRACLVIEASLKSGSLISARLANEYNREVFALPGSVESPYTQGTHTLIKQGAILTEGAQSIYHELKEQIEQQQQSDSINKNSTNARKRFKKIINILPKKDCLSLSQMLKCVPLPLPQLQTQLIELECQGLIKRVLGGYQRT